MTRTKLLVTAGVVMVLALVAVGQTDVRPGGDPPQPLVIMPAQPQSPGGPGPAYQVVGDQKPGPVRPGARRQAMGEMMPGPVAPGGPGPMPAMRMREYAEQLRLSAREAQELADRLRRQADELDQMAMRQMNRGPRPQNMQNMGPIQRELSELEGAIGRAEQEGRWQDAAELRQRAEQLHRSLQLMPAGPGMNGPQEMKRQIERLRAEAGRAKQEGRIEDSKRASAEADRVEQQLQPQKGPGVQQAGPRGDERAEIKGKIERLRDEARKAKEQGRHDDAARLGQEADRLEQQVREQGPGPQGMIGKPVPPEVQDILRAAEQAEREGRMDDARKQREKAQDVARRLEEQRRGPGDRQMGPRGDEHQAIKEKIGHLREEAQKAKEQNRFEDADRMWKEADRLEQQVREQGQGPKQPGPQLRDDLKRSLEEIKQEIGRLWQALNELRNRPQNGRPT